MIRPIVHSLRCLLIAMISIAMISARPAMMVSHAESDAPHRCGMPMSSHRSSHDDHRCPATDDGACCNDCVCACAIGSDVKTPVVAIVGFYAQITTVIDRPDEMVRPRQPLALRLPPPLGPPLLARS